MILAIRTEGMMGTSAKSSRYRSCGCCSLDTRHTSAEAVTTTDAPLHTLVLFSSWQHLLLRPNAYLLVTGQKGYRVHAVCLWEPASASPRKQNAHAYWGPGSQSLTTLHCHRQDTEQVRTPSSLCVREINQLWDKLVTIVRVLGKYEFRWVKTHIIASSI